jgi:superfamily II DNA or RNA helicase
VPTRVLLTQWLRELRTVYPGPVGCYGDGLRELQPVTLSTFESAYRYMAELGDRFDLLVIDEAHHFGQGLRDEALEMSAAPARLGLTATLPRDDTLLGRLQALMGPAVYELGIGDLAGRYLADFDLITLHVELTAEERASYEACMMTFRQVLVRFQQIAPGASWPDFARSCARTPAGRAALSAFRSAQRLLGYTEQKRAALRTLLQRNRGTRVLVFCADNQAAYAISREHLIMPITCDINAREREEALARFQRGELRALVSARVLNEGVDVPDADVAIVVAGTHGEREHVQRLGRLLRPVPGKRALCYELVTQRTLEVRHAQRRRAGIAARKDPSL